MIKLTKQNIWKIFDEKGKKPQKVDSIAPYLNDTIELAKNFTLEDLFKILQKNTKLYELIFASHLYRIPLKPYFDDIFQNCPKKDKSDLEHIELKRYSDLFTYRKKTDIENHVHVSGWGRYEPGEYEEPKQNLTHTSYGIGFTPLYKMKHLAIKLDKKFEIFPEWTKKKWEKMGNDEKARDKYFHTPIISGYTEFTVFEVFGEILFELSFYGIPENKDKIMKETVEIMEEHKQNEKDGIKKSKPVDELFKELRK